MCGAFHKIIVWRRPSSKEGPWRSDKRERKSRRRIPWQREKSMKSQALKVSETKWQSRMQKLPQRKKTLKEPDSGRLNDWETGRDKLLMVKSALAHWQRQWKRPQQSKKSREHNFWSWWKIRRRKHWWRRNWTMMLWQKYCPILKASHQHRPHVELSYPPPELMKLKMKTKK